MRKTFILEDLECANCGAKIESGVKALDGVNSATVTFMTQKMVIDAEEDKFNDIIKQTKKIIKKHEPDVVLREI